MSLRRWGLAWLPPKLAFHPEPLQGSIERYTIALRAA